MKISLRRRIFEISASVITGLGKILFVDVLEMKFGFIITACLFWIGYILYRYKQEPQIMRYWGLSMDHFSEVFRRLLPYALVCVGLFIAYGIYRDTLILHWHIIPIMLLYPLWGVIQQFLVVGLVAGNLDHQDKFSIPKWIIVLLTAILFSVVHFPSPLLIGGTFLLAIVYTIVYLRQRNLLALGLYHGWLGGLFYFFVLERDPFLEVFGQM